MRTRFIILFMGVALGLLLQRIFPQEETEPQVIPGAPIKATVPLEPAPAVDPPPVKQADEASLEPLVPALVFTAYQPEPVAAEGLASTGSASSVSLASGTDEFLHDSNALFHPHGEKVCASGCAASRHPTPTASPERIDELIRKFALEPCDATSPALEELLFLGRQTRDLLASRRELPLDAKHEAMLRREVQRTQVRIEMRLVNKQGETRCWLAPTVTPLDRRHVFSMETERLQPIVSSGTVKRVGLDSLWVRL
ncbi:hypothetical protein [Lignipirellula cremea]|uniref:Uncharacterized protein n=1 Tax=Lignipirellula cremea TaxID=2528010 RepID=A0A518DPA0_9BACT|nr:hypothetical protein [Lignipirellula cremea]QDU93662.1 hypothetical protein Pla8534_14430 [Lignipirellula cremea]